MEPAQDRAGAGGALNGTDGLRRRFRVPGPMGPVRLVGADEVGQLTEDDAVSIARLRAATRAHGLSLGDRAYLATGLRLGQPVVTADRSWATIGVGVTVHLIRP